MRCATWRAVANNRERVAGPRTTQAQTSEPRRELCCTCPAPGLLGSWRRPVSQDGSARDFAVAFVAKAQRREAAQTMQALGPAWPVSVSSNTPPLVPVFGDHTPPTPTQTPPSEPCNVCLHPVRADGLGALAAHAYPCFAAPVHLGCLVECLHHNGSCPSCRRHLAHLHSSVDFHNACARHQVDLHPAALPSIDTTHAIVRDYATRTFSRADAPEPEQPQHIRAQCCARVAGPAMGFVDLPHRGMH